MAKTKTKGNGEGTIYNNGKYWVGQITIGRDFETGKIKRKSFYGKTKKEVHEKMIQTKYELNNQIYIEPSNMYVSEWARYWLENFKKPELMDSTYEKYYRLIKVRIVEPFKYIKLKDLNSIEIQSYLNKLQSEDLTDRYIASIYKKLNAMLKKAVDLDLIRKNPCTGVVLPKSGNQKKVNVFTKEEQNRFVKQCEKDFYGKIFIFLLGTGMRIGEALALTWNDIDFEKEFINVCKTATEVYGKVVVHNKTKTPAGKRNIPISQKIKNLLQELYNEQNKELNTSQLVFYDKNYNHIKSSNLRYKLKARCKKANVTCLNIHALRHTFATRAIEQNINIKVLSTILGHSDISITLNTYSHALEEFQKETLKKIDIFQ